jgi:hypothetical protein
MIPNLSISNSSLTITFSPTDGSWTSMQYKGRSCLLEPGPVFDVLIEDKPLFAFRAPKLESVEEIAEGRGLRFTYRTGGLKLVLHSELKAEKAVLEQYLDITCEDMSAPRMLTGVTFFAPALCAERPEDCFLQTPGQAIPIDTPYTEAAKKPLDRRYTEPLPPYYQGWLECTPDQTPGCIAIENKRDSWVVSSWFYSDKVSTFPVVDGRNDHVHVEQRHQMSGWLTPGLTLTAERHVLMATEGNLSDHLTAFREEAYGTHLQTVAAPEWFEHAKLLQIAPYPLAPFAEKLETYADIGFTLIYLCPVQEGSWYRIDDHFKISEKVGTEEELKAFVTKCHDLGMKVVFDFIPQGISSNSPNRKEFEKWMVKDGFGRPFGSHGWGNRPGAPLSDTLSLDWGNPDYQDFTVDWAMGYVETFGIDGFRCDAMHWKEPNFDPKLDREAWTTAFGGFEILRKLRKRLKKRDPESVLLSETWGPLFQDCTDGSYENGWLIGKSNLAWMAGNPFFTGKDWQNYLATSRLARPEGFVRANFTANHDLKEVALAAKESPICDALNFLHTFCEGIPFVMWMEPDGREDFFKGLFQARDSLQGYTCSYDQAVADHPALFVAQWEQEGETTKLAVTNTNKDQTASDLISLPGTYQSVKSLYGSEGCSAQVTEGGVSVKLPKAGYVLLELF